MTEAKRPPGRPPIAEPEDERMEIRLSARRKASYKAAADRKGQPIGTWAKAVLDRSSKR